MEKFKVIQPNIYVVGHPAWVKDLTDTIKKDHQYADRDVTLLAEHAIEAKENKIWEYAFTDTPKTWERYCKERLDLPADYIDAIIVGVDALKNLGYEGEISADLAERVAKRAHHAEPLGAQGRPPKENQVAEMACDAEPLADYGNQSTQQNVDNYQHLKGGTSADYLTRRIARDRPDILERMKLGEFRSVRQAAIEAGIIEPKKRISIAVDPELAAVNIKRHFSVTQIRQLIKLLEE